MDYVIFNGPNALLHCLSAILSSNPSKKVSQLDFDHSEIG